MEPIYCSPIPEPYAQSGCSTFIFETGFRHTEKKKRNIVNPPPPYLHEYEVSRGPLEFEQTQICKLLWRQVEAAFTM